jgi:predicted secreted protein
MGFFRAPVEIRRDKTGSVTLGRIELQDHWLTSFQGKEHVMNLLHKNLASVPGIMRAYAVSVSVIAFVLMAGGERMFGSENTIHLTMKESGTSITLHSGDLLEVTLPATFGTGYSWKVANAADNILKAQGGPETAPAENGRKPGQTEFQVFRFAASAKGTGKLQLQYVRPWVKEEKPAKSFCVTVQVE